MKGICYVLLFLMGAVLLLSCSIFTGTPMRGSGKCRYVPSVEECQAEADKIEDFCLRACVRDLCRVGKPVCDQPTRMQCVRRSQEEQPNNDLGGYVPDSPKTCKVPVAEINWCEIPRTPPCQAKIMAHELCHACGWHHGDGQGAPGNNGRIQCL